MASALTRPNRWVFRNPLLVDEQIDDPSCACVSSRLLKAGSGGIILTDELHQFGQTISSPVDPALDGSDRAAENSGCLLVGQPVRPNEHDRLTLALRQLA